jgi:acetyltransferase-like isoleucine patch superfamily enzyme
MKLKLILILTNNDFNENKIKSLYDNLLSYVKILHRFELIILTDSNLSRARNFFNKIILTNLHLRLLFIKCNLESPDELIFNLKNNRGIVFIFKKNKSNKKYFIKSLFNSGYYLDEQQYFILCAYQAGCLVTSNINNSLEELDNELLGETKNLKFSLIESPIVRIPRPDNIKLSFGAQIYARSYISTTSIIKIGRCSLINTDCELNLGPAKLEVGNFTMISTYCNITGARHTLKRISTFNLDTSPYPFLNEAFDKYGDILIGSDVWIGSHVKILPGVKINNGAVVGTGSVVTKDIPPYAIVAGVPAKIINKRFSELVINKLLNIEWWNFPAIRLKRCAPLFNKEFINLPEKKQLIFLERLFSNDY